MRLPTGYSRTGRGRAGWVWGVVGGYLLVLSAIVAAPWWLQWVDGGDNWQVWAVATVVVLLTLAGLLFVPVQMGRQRPVTRRGLWLPLVAGGFLAGMLVFGGAMAVMEWARINDDMTGWCAMGAGATVWAGWAVLFYLMARRRGTAHVGMRLHAYLIAGSVLELLVAVPAHLIVRRRTECCAGILTGFGLATGIVVMVIAFGPAVAFLFVRRWRGTYQLDDGVRGFPVEMKGEDRLREP